MAEVTYYTDTTDHPRIELGPSPQGHALVFTDTSSSDVRGHVSAGNANGAGFVSLVGVVPGTNEILGSLLLGSGVSPSGSNVSLFSGRNLDNSPSDMYLNSTGRVLLQAGILGGSGSVEIHGGIKGEGAGGSARSVLRSWERHRAQGVTKTAGAGYVDYTYTYEVTFGNRPVVSATPTDAANNNDSDGRCWIRNLGLTSCIVRMVHADIAGAHTFDLDLTAVQ